MSLPTAAIDRLFDRLMATYGQQWVRLWDGVDPNAVKTLWAHELSGFAGRLDAIAWGLENLPPRCPNAIEFKILCRQAPAPETPALPAPPKADPARVAAELAKLGHIKREAPTETVDHKAWAKAIMRDVNGGLTRNPTVVSMAKRALRLA